LVAAVQLSDLGVWHELPPYRDRKLSVSLCVFVRRFIRVVRVMEVWPGPIPPAFPR
jgi:hypothetical protein